MITVNAMLSISRAHPVTLLNNTLNSINGLIVFINYNIRNAHSLNPIHSVDLLFIMLRKTILNLFVTYSKYSLHIKHINDAIIINVAESITVIWTVVVRVHAKLLLSSQYEMPECATIILTSVSELLQNISSLFQYNNMEPGGFESINDKLTINLNECKLLCKNAHLVHSTIMLPSYTLDANVHYHQLTTTYSEYSNLSNINISQEKQLLTLLLRDMYINLNPKASVNHKRRRLK
jgi:hypothetical protein